MVKKLQSQDETISPTPKKIPHNLLNPLSNKHWIAIKIKMTEFKIYTQPLKNGSTPPTI